MLVAAAFVPHTALLVPGAAGRAVVLDKVRPAALAAVGELVAARSDRVLVLVQHKQGPPRRVTTLRPSLTPAGVDDDALGWNGTDDALGWNGPDDDALGWNGPDDDAPEPHRADPRSAARPPVGASVALLLLRAGGWVGPVEVVTVPDDGAPGLRELGAELVSPDRVGLLLAGTLSARRGPDSPLPADPRAAAVDDAILGDLADLGPTAVARLAAVPAELARDLAISAWGPLQVLLGATRDGASCTVHHGGELTGTRYAVLSWRWP